MPDVDDELVTPLEKVTVSDVGTFINTTPEPPAAPILVAVSPDKPPPPPPPPLFAAPAVGATLP